MMKTFTIGVDIDDVLFDFNTGFLNYFNTMHDTFHTRNQIVNYQLHLLLGGRKEDIFFLIDKFYDSDDHQKVMPVEGSVLGIEKLRSHKLVLISARPEHSRGNIEKWLTQHFPSTVDEVHLTGSYRGMQPHIKTKAELAKKCGVDIFIEDSLSHAKNISESGVPVLLIDTPWNQGELSPLIIRVFSWEEIVKHVESIGN